MTIGNVDTDEHARYCIDMHMSYYTQSRPAKGLLNNGHTAEEKRPFGTQKSLEEENLEDECGHGDSKGRFGA
jgi:hypothetical protein